MRMECRGMEWDVRGNALHARVEHLGVTASPVLAVEGNYY